MNVEARKFMGWFMKYDAMAKELEISEKIDHKIVGLCLKVKVLDSGRVEYFEKVKIGKGKKGKIKSGYRSLKWVEYCSQ